MEATIGAVCDLFETEGLGGGSGGSVIELPPALCVPRGRSALTVAKVSKGVTGLEECSTFSVPVANPLVSNVLRDDEAAPGSCLWEVRCEGPGKVVGRCTPEAVGGCK
jgi:hypothetical protein